MCDWIALAGLGVQILIFVGLIWYAWETRDLRRASQKQNKISQEQTEAMQKPCLVPSVQVRADFDTAVENLSGNPYPGYRVVYDESDTGHVVLHNIGSGPAFNIRHEVQSPRGIKKDHLSGYLPYVRREGKETILLVADNLVPENQDKDVVLKLSYTSVRSHRHETEICIKNRKNKPVVTCYEFR